MSDAAMNNEMGSFSTISYSMLTPSFGGDCRAVDASLSGTGYT